MNYTDQAPELVLAAEEFERTTFSQFHRFSAPDDKIIRKLMAHGPLLLQGGRGTGKSALLIAASLRLWPQEPASPIVGLYISLRYVPLLKSEGHEYERLFCRWVSLRIREALNKMDIDFQAANNVSELRQFLSDFAIVREKRIVLLFDDAAAHIGEKRLFLVFLIYLGHFLVT